MSRATRIIGFACTCLFAIPFALWLVHFLVALNSSAVYFAFLAYGVLWFLPCEAVRLCRRAKARLSRSAVAA